MLLPSCLMSFSMAMRLHCWRFIPPSFFSFSAFDYIYRGVLLLLLLFVLVSGKGSFIYSTFIRHMDIWFGMVWHVCDGNSWAPF